MKRIILIDDDKMVNFLNRSILSRERVADEIVEYEAPEEALEYLKQVSEVGDCPDLILLDINMPSMNGWEFMKKFVSIYKKCPSIRVILLTSSIDPSDKRRAEKTYGVAAYQSKPLTSEVISSIREQFF